MKTDEYMISVGHKDVLYTLAILLIKEVRFIRNRMYFLSSRYERSNLTRAGIAYTLGSYS